jgi:micrococcal nuclease
VLKNGSWKFKLLGYRVYDGDTVMDMLVDLGFGITLSITGRLYCINAPEIRGETREAGLAARDWLKGRLDDAEELVVETIVKLDAPGKPDWPRPQQKGKFGRWLVRLHADGRNLNDEMVEAGHAREARY